MRQDLLADYSLIASEVVNQACSSLEHAIREMVSNSRERVTRFPVFWTTQKDHDRNLKERLAKNVSPRRRKIRVYDGQESLYGFLESIHAEAAVLQREPMGEGAQPETPLVVEIDNESYDGYEPATFQQLVDSFKEYKGTE